MMAGFFAALDASLPAERPERVLEVGVGEGEVAERLRSRWPGVALCAVDLPDPALAASWRERGLAGSFADIERLPFADGTFDLVLAIEVLEHVPDPPAALRELGRVAGARLVLSVPREPIWRVANVARGKYLRHLGNTPGHVNHWSKDAFCDLVARELTVRGVLSPFPWTMVSADVRR
ncbi:MAG: class I SAM-dependent methyltransferase [Actinobacteria bacterium]|nr:class I SAM-dependent methyltransferase [Actinomycetota bacterium]